VEKISFNPGTAFITYLWHAVFFWHQSFFLPRNKASQHFRARKGAKFDKLKADDIEKLSKQKLSFLLP
jgi:hypothetical protein